MMVVPRAWRELNRGLWVSPAKCLATVATLVTIINGAVGTVVIMFGMS